MKVFPACAGVILGDHHKRNRDPSVPRMCGGDPDYGIENYDIHECSPHVRG